MNLLTGISGFLILIISAIFLDTPIIAILAIPIYLIGAILIIIFYIKLLDKKEKMIIVPETITFIGVVLLCLTLGYASVEYNQFQGFISRDPEIDWNWNKILGVTGINLLASVLIYLGIFKGSSYQREELIVLTVPTLLAIPFVLTIIKLSVISGNWLGAGI